MSDSKVLPDSRCLAPKGLIRSKMGAWVPIFCASCGKEGGMVPEENMTFVFWLCRPCGEKCGDIAGMMMMPDEVFWEKVKQEQLAVYDRLLTDRELMSIVEEGTTSLATLIKEGV